MSEATFMQEEYRLIQDGLRQKRRYCVQCQVPLPFEPDVLRRIITREAVAATSWYVRRCRNPECGASDLQSLDDESDIEHEVEGIWSPINPPNLEEAHG